MLSLYTTNNLTPLSTHDPLSYACLGMVALGMPLEDLSVPRGSWARLCLLRVAAGERGG